MVKQNLERHNWRRMRKNRAFVDFWVVIYIYIYIYIYHIHIHLHILKKTPNTCNTWSKSRHSRYDKGNNVKKEARVFILVYVPTCLACLRVYVLMCLVCLRVNVPYVLTCSRAFRALVYVLTLVRCFRAKVPLRSYVFMYYNLKYKFSMTCFP